MTIIKHNNYTKIGGFVVVGTNFAIPLVTVVKNSKTKPHPAFVNFHEDEEGIVFVEYVVIALFVTILGAGSIFMLGVPMVRLYEWGSAFVLFPIP